MHAGYIFKEGEEGRLLNTFLLVYVSSSPMHAWGAVSFTLHRCNNRKMVFQLSRSREIQLSSWAAY